VPATYCFSYPADVPPGASRRTPGPRGRPSLNRMPISTCFGYLAAGSPGVRNGDAAQPEGQPGLPAGAYLSYPVWPCFRY
jgi:hypothetical protein